MALDEQDEVREHLEEANENDSNLDDRKMQVSTVVTTQLQTDTDGGME